MALMPKRVKYRKSQRGKMKGNATRQNYVAFGEFGLQALETSWITGKQIEAARVAATHFLHRSGKVYIRIFPSKSITKKPLEVRMGKGKAEVEQWVAVVKPGMVMFEMGGIGEDVAKRAMARVAHKMPIKCRFITRRHSA
ncbi:MAG: 50S ribosomal protein L16 [Planctomycetes bacterium ADurb.Bin401]|nr:MAG: 50S ribosomal protein L16 [Planctomycetes bacterium ADurb.Bin401]